MCQRYAITLQYRVIYVRIYEYYSETLFSKLKYYTLKLHNTFQGNLLKSVYYNVTNSTMSYALFMYILFKMFYF